jgi:hypothetical protein
MDVRYRFEIYIYIFRAVDPLEFCEEILQLSMKPEISFPRHVN